VNQRSERRKWIHLFDSVSAVLFFADLTGCFRTLPEDSSRTVLEESHMLFDELVNCRYFEFPSVILFLTKKDQLADMILRAKADPSKKVKEYQGGPEYEAFMQYVTKKYTNSMQNKRKYIYTHLMVTTDTKNVQFIFGACKDIVLCSYLSCCGLADGGVASAPSPSMNASRASARPGSTIGFAVGGAKDVINFRKKIRSNRVPEPTDITHEGIFYEYYFDTSGKTKSVESTKLFYPSYSSAVCKNPLTQEIECYLSVGLNSSLKQEDFKRKKLNIIIVLDMSGSMSSPFDGEPFSAQNKMTVANQSVVSLLNHLEEGDSFGLIAYDDTVEEICSQRIFDKSTDLSKLKDKILAIKPRGGTDMHRAMTTGHKILTKFLQGKKEYRNRELYENRMIFLTDAMPTVGLGSSDIAEFGMKMTRDSIPIYTTYIGVGIDFDTQVVSAITKIPGANYFTVQSSSEFKKRMDTEFEYMVTPLVFDLKLAIQSTNFIIDKVIGSPEADKATGELMKVNTLFPSKRTEEGAKGGVILIRLKPKPRANDNSNSIDTNSTNGITLTSSYQDRAGKVETETQSVEFENLASIFSEEPHCYFDNTGIHKAIVLCHYVELLQNWSIMQKFPLNANQKELFEKMVEYLTTNAEQVEDDTLMQEVQILDVILNAKPLSTSQSAYFATPIARKFWCLCSGCENKDQSTM